MFLPFIKKNSTELDLILKIKSKYSDLPFSSILGLVWCYFEFGKERLNKDIEKFIIEQDIKKAVENYVLETVPHTIIREFDLQEIAPYSELIYIRDELYEKFDDSNDLIQFAFVIAKNDTGIFKTTVSDIIDTDRNPGMSVINIILNRRGIFENLKSHIKLTSIKSSITKDIKFSSLKNLKVVLLASILQDPEKELTHYLRYKEPSVSLDNPYSDSDQEPNIVDIKVDMDTRADAADAVRYTYDPNPTDDKRIL